MKKELLEQVRTIAFVTGRRIHLRIPSVLAEGEEFALKISVTGYDALPVETFPNTFHFADSQGIEGLPDSYRLEPGSSTGVIPGLKATGTGVALVEARMEVEDAPEVDLSVYSNPGWIFQDPSYRLFWGDLHVHTKYSNCSAWRCVDPEWCYQYAREISLLDFAAAADHLRGIVSEEGRWTDLQNLARQYTVPGKFAAFLAFESSHARGYGGDNNVYYRDDDAPYFWRDREDMKGIAPKVHLEELWEELDATGKGYFTAPHHTGRSGKYRSWDEDYHDPNHEPLFEIYSSWGSSEKRWSRFPIDGGKNDDPSYFVDALKAGARFGVIASSDDHATLPAGVRNHRVRPFRPRPLKAHSHKGLAAVRCPELKREALFDSMMERNTYATTDALSLMEVRIGDARMGEEIQADSNLRQQRRIRVRYTAHDAAACRIILVRNGEELAEKSIRGPETMRQVNEVIFEDNDPLNEVALRGAKYHPEPFVAYYVRAEDRWGAHQWSSPIWIDA